MKNNKSFRFLSGVLISLNLMFLVLLVWSFGGGTWNPLTSFYAGISKIVGLLFLSSLVVFFVIRQFRERLSQAFSWLNKAPHSQAQVLGILTTLLIGMWLAFLVIYKHNSLQSYIYNMGMFLNVTWNFAHGFGLYHSIEHMNSFFGDHWMPVLVLFSGLIRIWPEPRILLLTQAFFVSFGMMGLYRLTYHLIKRRDWALCISLLFLFNPFLHRIQKTDFQPESFAIPLILWALYFLFAKNKRGLGFLLLSLTWFLKEDLMIVTFGLGLSFLFIKEWRKFGWILSGTSIVMFCFIVSTVMPLFFEGEALFHLNRYSYLGSTPKAILHTMLLKPHIMIMNIFGDLNFWKSIIYFLIATFFLPLFYWQFSLAGLVSVAPHLISSFEAQRSLGAHYSMGALAILSVGSAFGLKQILSGKIKFYRIKTWVEWLGPYPFIAFSVGLWALRVFPYAIFEDNARIQIFRTMIKDIPPQASVSAQFNLGAYVAMRHKLYEYPDVSSADYILLDNAPKMLFYIDIDRLHKKAQKLIDDGLYIKVKDEAGFSLIRKTTLGLSGEVAPGMKKVAFFHPAVANVGSVEHVR